MKSSVLEGNYIVLGADGNLGPFWVQAILQNGGKVLGLGLQATISLELQKLSQEFPSKLEVIDFDLNLQTAASIEGRLQSDFSGVVLNAGIDSLPGTGHSSIEEFSAEDWETTFRVNVFGNINFLNYLLSNSKLSQASIVFIGSMYSLVSPPKDLYSHFNGGKGATKNPAYAASKAALASAVRQYGTNLASRGLRVNMLSPGGVLGTQDEHFLAKFASKTPSGKMINPEALGDHLVYLLSSMSTNLVGQNLIIDDGYSAW